jgi:hypothetical protein
MSCKRLINPITTPNPISVTNTRDMLLTTGDSFNCHTLFLLVEFILIYPCTSLVQHLICVEFYNLSLS